MLQLLFPALLLLSSCTKEEDALPFKERGTIIATSEVGSLSKDEVVQRVTELDAGPFSTYGVRYHVITYRSDYQGEGVDTKGLLILPVGVDSVPLIACFHGTQLPLDVPATNNQIPSEYRGQADEDQFTMIRNMGLFWASAGYAVFMPDYVGFTSTSEKEHPYLYYPELFKANIDGLLAARSYLTQLGHPDDNRLFLSGWSQGGGACLSAHRFIQEQYSDRFTVVASSGLAGPYNVLRTIRSIFEAPGEENEGLGIYSWGVYSMNKFSNVKRPTDQMWSYPVYDQISSVLTPSHKPEEVFIDYFLTGVTSGSDPQMVNLLKENSFFEGWTPVGKVFLHHGDSDQLVPYFNSVDAYNGLTAAGGDVQLYTYPGGDHATELGNFSRTTLVDFNAQL
ncbi:MAG: prolyl oligopeptidase family serine peptidase [Flavobacteriales bacterium]|nr:prolyl oligopeptidase family serine peptidase [Flavobacteriales bacterium]